VWVATLALAAAATMAQAQTNEPQTTEGTVTFGGAVGATIPIGDFGDFANLGFHLQGMGGFRLAYFPLALRVDVTYHRLGGEDAAVGGVTFNGPDSRIISGTINGLWYFPGATEGTTSNFYGVFGVGIYNMNVDFDNPVPGASNDSETGFGINAGGGYRFNLAGFSTFVEARFHNAFGAFRGAGNNTESAQFIPVSVGIMFR